MVVVVVVVVVVVIVVVVVVVVVFKYIKGTVDVISSDSPLIYRVA